MNIPNEMMKHLAKEMETKNFIENLKELIPDILESISVISKVVNSNSESIESKLNEMILEHNKMKAMIKKMHVPIGPGIDSSFGDGDDE